MEKRLNKPSSDVSDEANNQGTAGPQPATSEVKTKGYIVDGCSSFCLYDVIINFSQEQNQNLIRRQTFASLQHGFLWSEENVVLYNFETPKGVWENVLTYNILTLIFIKSLFRADVMPQCCTGRYYAWQLLFAI